MKHLTNGRVPIASLADRRTFEAGFEHIRKNDPLLRPLLDDRGMIDFEPRGELFESLVESILSQQLAGAAADSIIRRVRALFPRGKFEPERVGLIDPGELRSAGVSPQKLSYLKDLSSRIVDGRLDLEGLRHRPDEEIVETLDEVRGIGPWTVHMLLIFTLGRPNVFPVDDYGVRKSIQVVYGLADLPKRQVMEEIAEKWHPYRTVASLYLWHARDKA